MSDHIIESNQSNLKQNKPIAKNKDKTNYTIVVKKDINDDDYLNNLHISLHHIIKDEELTKETQSKLKVIKVKIDDYAVDKLDVGEIIEPEY